MPSEKKRKTRSSSSKGTTEESKPQVCVICGGPAALEQEYCAVHLVSHFLVGEAVAATQKAFKSGNVAGMLGGAVAATILQAGGPAIERAMASSGAGPAHAQPPPRRPARDPAWGFRVLGLDPKRATADDVKRMQRELAKLYHPDSCGETISKEKMAEVNAAAEACLAYLGKR